MYLIGNGPLFTRDQEHPFYENGAIYIEKGIIMEVGTFKEMQTKYAHVPLIDAKNQWIMPALINPHHHIYSAFGRGISIDNHQPNNFIDVLEGMWWKLDEHLSIEDCIYSAKATFIDSIENGVTTIFDHHASYGATKNSLIEIAKVAQEYGLRACLSYEISDRHGKEKMEEALNENLSMIEYAKQDQNDQLAAMIGLHASFTLSDETLQTCLAKKPKDVGFHIHIAEGIEDVEDSISKYGIRTVHRLDQLGILDDLCIAGHCIHIDESEMACLKNRNVAVIHNPESNMGNAVGCPDVLTMMKKGILMGLGSDGYTSDVFESYKVANILHKHEKHHPNVAWSEIPEMLFENNAKIANRYFKTPLGKIKQNYSADIIFIDYDPLTPVNVNNVNSHLLFGVNGKSVTMTMARGNMLMRDRQLIGIDKHEVMKESRRLAEACWKRINKREGNV